MTFEQFSDGHSFLHRADPRGKLIGAGVLSLIISLSRNLSTVLLGLLLALILVPVARLSWKKILHRLLVVNGFNLLLCLVLPLTYTGGGPGSAGFLLALLITVKSNAVVLLFISLLATSTTARLGHGLRRLGLSPKLCLLLLFSYRYTEIIQRELSRLQRAATLRCFQPGTNLHTYRTYSYMLGMMLVRSWNRAERIQQAMELRGFSGQFHSLHREERMQRSDWLLPLILLLAALGLAVFELRAAG